MFCIQCHWTSLYMQFPKWYNSMGYIMFNKIIFCLITSLIILINL